MAFQCLRNLKQAIPIWFFPDPAHHIEFVAIRAV
ncbi:uncharacterized protein METZ01_LOCUS241789, partial [marine metagenome]